MPEIDLTKAQHMLTQFGKTQVPLIGYCDAKLIEVSDQHCKVVLPLSDKTKNHLDCMYFGALSVGADITGGFLAMLLTELGQQPVELLFKDFSADFKRRANGDTHFVCHDGQLIQEMIQTTLATGERVNKAIFVTATVPDVAANKVVANFQLTLSLKYKPQT
jgi:acyl-coenzyme A thioesterase PaaI-like protein